MRKTLLIAPPVLLAAILLAQDRVDLPTTAKIRSEELEHSQIMRIEHMLTDRYGPRMTGTPNHEAAAKWAVAEMTQWGMKNAHLEPWDFARPGWLNDRAMAGPDHPSGFDAMLWFFGILGLVAFLCVALLWRRELGPCGHGLESRTAGTVH